MRGEPVDNIILEIGLALGLIAFAVALANKLGLSNIPFLILIGIAVGPHAPQFGVFDFRFIETDSLITFMGRIGVLFLLFYLGLEANLTRLIEAGRSILVGGSIYVGINFTVGFTYGYLAGFPLREALIIAGLTTVSSSAIVAKILFDYRRMANPETQIVLGITMFEDVFLAVYLSLISGIVLSGATSFAGVLSSGGIALGFIVGLIIIGRWATPLLNRVLRISSSELFVDRGFCLPVPARRTRRDHPCCRIYRRVAARIDTRRNRTQRANGATRGAVPRFLRRHLLFRLRSFD